MRNLSLQKIPMFKISDLETRHMQRYEYRERRKETRFCQAEAIGRGCPALRLNIDKAASYICSLFAGLSRGDDSRL